MYNQQTPSSVSHNALPYVFQKNEVFRNSQNVLNWPVCRRKNRRVQREPKSYQRENQLVTRTDCHPLDVRRRLFDLRSRFSHVGAVSPKDRRRIYRLALLFSVGLHIAWLPSIGESCKPFEKYENTYVSIAHYSAKCSVSLIRLALACVISGSHRLRTIRIFS